MLVVMRLGFEVYGLGCGDWGLEFSVKRLGFMFRIEGSGFVRNKLGFKLFGFELWVRVLGLGSGFGLLR